MHGKQLKIPPEYNRTIKLLFKHIQQKKAIEECSINKEYIYDIFNILMNKIDIYRNVPGFSATVEKLKNNQSMFASLDNNSRVDVIKNLITVMDCSKDIANLSAIDCGANVGRAYGSNCISSYSTALLINQSPTGLYEEVIDLKTVRPKVNKQDRE